MGIDIDANKNLQNLTPIAGQNIIIPTGLGIKYIRLCLYSGGNSYIDIAMFGELRAKPTTYKSASEYFVKVLDSGCVDEIGRIALNQIDIGVPDYFNVEKSNGVIKVENTNFFKATPINLIDEGKFTHGYVVPTTGLFTSNEFYRCSDFITVNFGETYSTNAVVDSNHLHVLYNEEKVFIKAVPNATEFSIDDVNAKYIRVNFIASTENKMMNLGEALKPYVTYEEHDLDIIQPYYKKSLAKNLFSSDFVSVQLQDLINKSKPLYNLKWGCLGDSITSGGTFGTIIAGQESLAYYNYGSSGTRIAEYTGRTPEQNAQSFLQ